MTPTSPHLKHLTLPDLWSFTEPQGLALLERLIDRQGRLLAYIADFQLLALSIAICIPILFVMNNPHKSGAPVVAGS